MLPFGPVAVSVVVDVMVAVAVDGDVTTTAVWVRVPVPVLDQYRVTTEKPVFVVVAVWLPLAVLLDVALNVWVAGTSKTTPFTP